MSVTNLRRAGEIDPQVIGSLGGVGHTNLTIESVQQIDWEPLVENHPYPEQVVFTGEATYDEPSNYTNGREIHLDFELRTGSRLFLLEFQTDIDSVESVTTLFSQAADESVTIYRNLHAPEDALWSFLEQADRVINITVLDEGEEVSYREVEDVAAADVIGSYAIESAEVGFNYNDASVYVRYRDGSLQVESDADDGEEYVIQLFEREVLGPA
ncbi:hypothetical protein [Halobaculum roseum]|uniref:Uncharacterized protein n=1 Tax=Halobaculum roseum TaxID=2175149 RepID=A0ABD5MJ37_9EURY|nr:hypothetical protein [Halobaculum roseum]QZY04236.1 hypothetical protein K6T36_16115 [Halobaculum roseum]